MGRREWERGGEGVMRGGRWGTPKVGSHHMSEILKNTDCRTDLIGGGGQHRRLNTLAPPLSGGPVWYF